MNLCQKPAPLNAAEMASWRKPSAPSPTPWRSSPGNTGPDSWLMTSRDAVYMQCKCKLSWQYHAIVTSYIKLHIVIQSDPTQIAGSIWQSPIGIKHITILAMANFARLHLSETEFKWTTWDKLAGFVCSTAEKVQGNRYQGWGNIGQIGVAHLKHKKYPNLDIRAKMSQMSFTFEGCPLERHEPSRMQSPCSALVRRAVRNKQRTHKHFISDWRVS